MDTEPICFQNLYMGQKLFQEQLEDLIKKESEQELKLLNINILNKTELYFKNIRELSEETNQLQVDEFALLKEQHECNKQISEISKTITLMDETLRNLNDENSLGTDELGQIKKPLLKAIKKYSTCFDMYVEVQLKPNTETEAEIFLASVKFSKRKEAKVMQLLINRKTRVILDFNADSFSYDQQQELDKARTKNGVDIFLLLHKLRDSHIL